MSGPTHAREETDRSGHWRARAVLRPARPLTDFEAIGPIRTLAECGEIMGLTIQRASYLEQVALSKLRRALIEHGVVDADGRLVREVEE